MTNNIARLEELDALTIKEVPSKYWHGTNHLWFCINIFVKNIYYFWWKIHLIKTISSVGTDTQSLPMVIAMVSFGLDSWYQLATPHRTQLNSLLKLKYLRLIVLIVVVVWILIGSFTGDSFSNAELHIDTLYRRQSRSCRNKLRKGTDNNNNVEASMRHDTHLFNNK